MNSNRGIILEVGCGGIIKKLIGMMISLNAFADEGSESEAGDEADTGASKSAPSINYEDLIAKARKEEKEKQYKVIEKLKGQVNTLTEQHNQDLLVKSSLEKQLEEAKINLTKAGTGDTEEIKTLKETIASLEKTNKTLEEQVKSLEGVKPVSREEVEAEIRAELETEYEVKTYKATKLAELKDELLVPELVFGTTKEEIDNSIQSALERSAEIKKSLGYDSKPKRTPKTPSNPSVDTFQDREVSLERLAGMDVRSPEYSELRKKLGLK